MNATDLADALRAALAQVLDSDEFDVVAGPGEDELEAATDDWTLRIEGWPDGVAWLAIDDEPDESAGAEALHTARRRAMSSEVDEALAALDQRLAGRLTAALRAAHDPLSQDLADALAAGG